MEKELIDNLGGIGAVAEALKVDRSAVGNWRLAGRSIPSTATVPLPSSKLQ